MNPFDAIQENAFDTVTATMGYDATWTPQGTTTEQTARILLKEPTQEYSQEGFRYTPFNYLMEYRRGFFNGLIDSARRNASEIVTIGENTYYVRSVRAKYDGKTYVALLEIIPPPPPEEEEEEPEPEP